MESQLNEEPVLKASRKKMIPLVKILLIAGLGTLIGAAFGWLQSPSEGLLRPMIGWTIAFGVAGTIISFRGCGT